MKKTMDEPIQLSNLAVPAFGYEIIREELLPDLLGKDGPTILYWAGKRLARKYPLFSIDEIYEFFRDAGWGNLQMTNSKEKEITFSLTSELIRQRIEAKTDTTFQLEAGFLAEQITQQKKVYAEAYEHPKKKEGNVIFTVKWDNIPFA